MGWVGLVAFLSEWAYLALDLHGWSLVYEMNLYLLLHITEHSLL